MLKWFPFLCIASLLFAQGDIPDRKLWKGNAILGANDICFVYSDDARIIQKEKSGGIRHLYYKDYTVDYISSTRLTLFNGTNELKPVGSDSIYMKNDCAAATLRRFPGGSVEMIAYGAKGNTVAIRCIASVALKNRSFAYTFLLRKEHITSRKTTLNGLSIEGSDALASWSNGVYAVFSASSSFSIVKSDSLITFRGRFNKSGKAEFYITLGDNSKTIKESARSIRKGDTFAAAVEHNMKWLTNGQMPLQGKSAEENILFSYYNRTLLATKAACLRGQIPADMTGQFVTDNMPQLYPRDAMKSARVLLATGHTAEAKSIISFWTNPGIPKKSPGEFFARYDAYAQAVDGGSGARYDEPEWDANGYLIQLLNAYHEKTGTWLADKFFIYSLADFLCSKIDSEGLLYEGGIVEWTGYLPTTNMVCETGLETAGKLAATFGDKEIAARYSLAAETIRKNLSKMIDPKRNTFADIRFHGGKTKDNHSLFERTPEKLYMWDVTTQFAALWGFPDYPMLSSSIEFFEKNCVKLDGGFQYFEAMDPGISGYGGDVFFFTTASMAQYYCLTKTPAKALPLIRWMVKNSNCYGLMPERIYLDNSDCSDASPLSWCNAEFALAVYQYSAAGEK